MSKGHWRQVKRMCASCWLVTYLPLYFTILSTAWCEFGHQRGLFVAHRDHGNLCSREDHSEDGYDESSYIKCPAPLVVARRTFVLRLVTPSLHDS